jgi:hypothetical protein
MALTYGVDFIVSYEDLYSKLEESHRTIEVGGSDPVIRRTTIYFGGNSGEFVPMFCPYIQTGIQLNKNTKLVLGFGVYGQFYKSYFFNMNIADSIPGSSNSFFVGSGAFHMWVPFLRAGIELF